MDNLDALAGILSRPPSQEAWESCCAELEATEDAQSLDAKLVYAHKMLANWPWELRKAPDRWLRAHPRHDRLIMICRYAVALDMHHCLASTADYWAFLQSEGKALVAGNGNIRDADQDLLFKYVWAEHTHNMSFVQATPAGAGSALMRYDHSGQILTNLLALFPDNAPTVGQHAAQVWVLGRASAYALVAWWSQEGSWAWQLFKEQGPVWSHHWEGQPIFLHGYTDPYPCIFLLQPGDTQLYALRFDGHGAKLIPLGIHRPKCVCVGADGRLYAVDGSSRLYQFGTDSFMEVHFLLELSESYYPPIGMAISEERILAIRPMHPDYSDIQDQVTSYFGGIYTWTREHGQYEPGPAYLFSEAQDFLMDGWWDIDQVGEQVVWVANVAGSPLNLVIWDAKSGRQHVILTSDLLYQTTGVRFVDGNHDIVRLILQDRILDVRVSFDQLA